MMFAPRAALQRTLRWLSKFSKNICRGCRKKQVGVLKQRVFRPFHFPIRHHEWFLLRSRSDFHDGIRYDYVANVANFWEHSRIRSSWFSLIHLHCSKINQSDMYRQSRNLQGCVKCSKDVALVAKLVRMRPSCCSDPRVRLPKYVMLRCHMITYV